mmetsp:Transcript_12032/g.25623  ORF Transcript_12032/g.25623 Transcript_12032/m.25623 type:complete len:642 (-) Transcript_12032:87-2012(-)
MSTNTKDATDPQQEPNASANDANDANDDHATSIATWNARAKFLNSPTRPVTYDLESRATSLDIPLPVISRPLLSPRRELAAIYAAKCEEDEDIAHYDNEESPIIRQKIFTWDEFHSMNKKRKLSDDASLLRNESEFDSFVEEPLQIMNTHILNSLWYRKSQQIQSDDENSDSQSDFSNDDSDEELHDHDDSRASAHASMREEENYIYIDGEMLETSGKKRKVVAHGTPDEAPVVQKKRTMEVTPEKNANNEDYQTPNSKVPHGVVDIDSFPYHSDKSASSSEKDALASPSFTLRQNQCQCQIGLDAMTLWNWQQGPGSELVENDRMTEQWWLDSTITNQTTTVPLQEHLDYMDGMQPHLTNMRRAEMIVFMVALVEEYTLSSKTLYLCATIFDRALACFNLSFHLRGAVNGTIVKENKDALPFVYACVMIASKIEDVDPPLAVDFVHNCNVVKNKQDIVDMERKICNTLKFAFGFQTPYHYIDRFIRASQVSSSSTLCCRCVATGNGIGHTTNDLLEQLIHYLLDLSIVDYKLFVTTRPSLLTASAVYLARATLGITEGTPNVKERSHVRNKKLFWSKTLEYYTSYSMKNLECTVKTMRNLHEYAEGGVYLRNVFEKHAGSRGREGISRRTVMIESDLGFN